MKNFIGRFTVTEDGHESTTRRLIHADNKNDAIMQGVAIVGIEETRDMESGNDNPEEYMMHDNTTQSISFDGIVQRVTQEELNTLHKFCAF
jgi:hypothetical protein